MDQRMQEINELLTKQEFLNELKKAENDEDVQKLFAKNGVELSLEEIAKMVEESGRAHELSEQGELSEDALEDVSGGVVGTFLVAVGSIAFYSSYGYHRYIKRR